MEAVPSVEGVWSSSLVSDWLSGSLLPSLEDSVGSSWSEVKVHVRTNYIVPEEDLPSASLS